MSANASTGILDPCILRISIRKVTLSAAFDRRRRNCLKLLLTLTLMLLIVSAGIEGGQVLPEARLHRPESCRIRRCWTLQNEVPSGRLRRETSTGQLHVTRCHQNEHAVRGHSVQSVSYNVGLLEPRQFLRRSETNLTKLFPQTISVVEANAARRTRCARCYRRDNGRGNHFR